MTGDTFRKFIQRLQYRQLADAKIHPLVTGDDVPKTKTKTELREHIKSLEVALHESTRYYNEARDKLKVSREAVEDRNEKLERLQLALRTEASEKEHAQKVFRYRLRVWPLRALGYTLMCFVVLFALAATLSAALAGSDGAVVALCLELFTIGFVAVFAAEVNK